MKTKKEKKPVSALAIERLDATLGAVESDLGRFNQSVWVRGTKNGKHAEMCFACVAIDLFGDAAERASMTFDGSYNELGSKVLDLDISTATRLFWGGNDLDDIKKIIIKLKGDRDNAKA